MLTKNKIALLVKERSTVFYAFVLRTLSAFSTFVVVIAISKLYAPDESGVFFFHFAIFTIASLIFRFGLENVMIRDVSVSKKESGNELELQFSWGAIAFVGAVSLIPSAIFYFITSMDYQLIQANQVDIKSLGVLLISMPFFNVMQLVSYCYLGAESHARSYFYLNILWVLLFLSGAVFARLIDHDIRIETAFAFSVITASSCSLVSWYNNIGFDSKAIYYIFSRLKNQFATGWQLMQANAASNINIWLPLILLGFYVEAESIAHYQLGLRTAMVVGFVGYALTSILAPRIAKLTESRKKLAALVFEACGLSFLASVVVATPLYIFIDEYLFFFGEGYVQFTDELAIMIFVEVIVALTCVFGMVLAMTGNENSLRIYMGVGAFVTIAMSFVLIPVYGALGAILSGGSGIITGNALCFLKLRHQLKLRTIR